MEALISIAFGYAYPVFKPAGIRPVHVGDHRVGKPAFAFFARYFAVYHYADGKKIKNVFYSIVLLFHLVPYGIDALGAAFDFEFQAFCRQFILDGCYEICNICVAPAFGFV